MHWSRTTFDWDKIVSKNVRSNDMQDLGKIAEIDTDSFIILQDADRRYRIPKSCVEGFRGNDVLVDFRFNDLLLVELASPGYDKRDSKKSEFN
jgi:hypothetical protein